jgi:hypothetical protein
MGIWSGPPLSTEEHQMQSLRPNTSYHRVYYTLLRNKICSDNPGAGFTYLRVFRCIIPLVAGELEFLSCAIVISEERTHPMIGSIFAGPPLSLIG